MDTSDLAKRMKGYEERNRYYLQRRTPVILRLDMRAGHSFTKGFVRPFDEVFIKSMQETEKYLCENIQGCKLSYQQSDEITLVLVDYDKLSTDCFFDYRVDKLCSIVASMVTMAFNKFFADNIEMDYNKKFHSLGLDHVSNFETEVEYDKVFERLEAEYETYYEKNGTAMFDARCFNIPKEEVTNLIYWRQLDAMRNSVQMVGQANFSHRELQNKTCKDIKEMLIEQKGINWDELPIYQKRGSCCVKEIEARQVDGVPGIERSHWIIDKEIPIFKDEDREYIDRLVFIGER